MKTDVNCQSLDLCPAAFTTMTPDRRGLGSEAGFFRYAAKPGSLREVGATATVAPEFAEWTVGQNT